MWKQILCIIVLTAFSISELICGQGMVFREIAAEKTPAVFSQNSGEPEDFAEAGREFLCGALAESLLNKYIEKEDRDKDRYSNGPADRRRAAVKVREKRIFSPHRFQKRVCRLVYLKAGRYILGFYLDGNEMKKILKKRRFH